MFLPTDVNPMNLKIQEFIVILIIFKKIKFRFVIELDTIITCIRTLRL